MKINWIACIIGAIFYVLFMVIIGDLLINSAYEYVGPVTDMVITTLLLLIITYVVARKTKEYTDQLWGGVIAGGFCFVAQLILSGLTVGIELTQFLVQVAVFFGAGLAGGFAAQRL